MWKQHLKNLEKLLTSIFLKKSIPASILFSFDKNITDDKSSIPIQDLENALRIYEKIISKYPHYIDQFYEAVARILNMNYDPMSFLFEDGDLPFWIVKQEKRYKVS